MSTKDQESNKQQSVVDTDVSGGAVLIVHDTHKFVKKISSF